MSPYTSRKYESASSDIDVLLTNFSKTMKSLLNEVKAGKYGKYKPAEECDLIAFINRTFTQLISSEVDPLQFTTGKYDFLSILPNVDGIFPYTCRLKRIVEEVREALSNMRSVLNDDKSADHDRFMCQETYRLQESALTGARLRIYQIQRHTVFDMLGAMIQGTQYEHIYEQMVQDAQRKAEDTVSQSLVLSDVVDLYSGMGVNALGQLLHSHRKPWNQGNGEAMKHNSSGSLGGHATTKAVVPGEAMLAVLRRLQGDGDVSSGTTAPPTTPLSSASRTGQQNLGQKLNSAAGDTTESAEVEGGDSTTGTILSTGGVGGTRPVGGTSVAAAPATSSIVQPAERFLGYSSKDVFEADWLNLPMQTSLEMALKMLEGAKFTVQELYKCPRRLFDAIKTAAAPDLHLKLAQSLTRFINFRVVKGASMAAIVDLMEACIAKLAQDVPSFADWTEEVWCGWLRYIVESQGSKLQLAAMITIREEYEARQSQNPVDFCALTYAEFTRLLIQGETRGGLSNVKKEVSMVNQQRVGGANKPPKSKPTTNNNQSKAKPRGGRPSPTRTRPTRAPAPRREVMERVPSGVQCVVC
jgi:hypothetical protein